MANPLFRKNPAKAGGNIPALVRGPIAARGGNLPALGYRAPQVEGGSGGVRIYPLGPLGAIGIGGSEGGQIPLPGLSNLSFSIGGSKPSVIPGSRSNVVLRNRAQAMVAAQKANNVNAEASPGYTPPVQAAISVLPSRGAGAPPKAYPNYKVYNVPANVYSNQPISQAMPVAPAPGPVLTPEVLPAASAATLPQRSLLSGVLANLGLAEATAAAAKLLTGQALTGPEFGAIAGAIVGSFADDPAAGAKIGAGIGTVFQSLDALSVAQTGHSIDSWITQGTKNLYASLTGNTAPQPIGPAGPGYGAIRTVPQPGSTPSNPLNINPVPQPGVTPMPNPNVNPLSTGTIPQQLPVQLPSGGLNPNIAPQPQPCTNCGPIQEGDCPPEVQELVNQIANCPPQLLQKVFDRLQIRQRPGQQPQIVVAEPICLCCDSENDLDQYIKSGGVLGACTQVLGATVSDVQKQ